MKQHLLFLLNLKPVFWALLAIPSLPLVRELVFPEPRYHAELMYLSGLWSVQLIVAALLLSPLMTVLGGVNIIGTALRWLVARRRAIGVAGFSYAALHTLFYLREVGSWEEIAFESVEMPLLVGWLAMLVLTILAATSNKMSMKWLGRGWKTLQRGAYSAAILVAFHWYLVGQFLQELLVWFLPLTLLEIIRILKNKGS